MTLRPALLAAALAIGFAAPASAALAYADRAPAPYGTTFEARDGYGSGKVYGASRTGWCVPSSASEGNANQQNFPVKQYGQTSGGSAC